MPSQKEVALRKAIREFIEEQVEQSIGGIRDQVFTAMKDTMLGRFGGTALHERIVPAAVSAPSAPAKRSRGRPPKSEFKKPECNVTGCHNPAKSRGYCNKHYQKARSHGWPMPAPRGFHPPANSRPLPKETQAEQAPAASEQESRTRTFEVPAE